MKTLATIAIMALMLVPASAQAPTLTGKWSGTMSRIGDDGAKQEQGIVFNLTQKGKVLTGTAGPNDERQWAVEKGVVTGAKSTFKVQQPNGPLFTFTLTLAKGRLQGDMIGELNGQKREMKVDLTKAK
jgi:hypothetical protein